MGGKYVVKMDTTAEENGGKGTCPAVVEA